MIYSFGGLIMEKKNKKSKWRAIRRVILGVTLAVIAFLVFFAVDVFDMDEWHDFEPELILDSKKSLMVYDKNGGRPAFCTVRKTGSG